MMFCSAEESEVQHQVRARVHQQLQSSPEFLQVCQCGQNHPSGQTGQGKVPGQTSQIPTRVICNEKYSRTISSLSSGSRSSSMPTTEVRNTTLWPCEAGSRLGAPASRAESEPEPGDQPCQACLRGLQPEPAELLPPQPEPRPELQAGQLTGVEHPLLS